MIVYRDAHVLLHLSGSAIPNATWAGCASGLVALVLQHLVPRETLDSLFHHPFAFQPLAHIVVFSLVFRINVAYGRYWESCTQVAQLSAKLSDATAQAVSFDEVTSPQESIDAHAARRRFQARLLHLASLTHALALQYLRRDNNLSSLSPQPISSAEADGVSLGAAHYVELNSAVPRHIPVASGSARAALPVLGGVSERELDRIRASDDAIALMVSLMLICVNERRARGGLIGASAPVLARFYSLLADGELGFRQARKIEDIPFPWPWAQMLAFLLVVFSILFPFVVVACTSG